MAKDSKDNLNPQIAAFGAELDAIRKEAGEAHIKLEGHHALVRGALVKTYALGLKLIEQDLLKDFLEANVKHLTNRYKKNAFHDIVTLGFPLAREDSHSKYRKVLKFAQDEYWDVETFKENLNASKLDDLYLRALKADAFDPDAKFEESEQDHYNRAKALLCQTSYGSLPLLNLNGVEPHQVDGFATAILRITNTSAEVVGFLPKEPEDIVVKRISSVAAIPPKRMRAKLMDKDLYEFYVICDVFQRCMPDPQERFDRRKQTKDAALAVNIPIGSTAAEAATLLSAKPKEKRETIAEAIPTKNVLWLSKLPAGADLNASIGTMSPAMIIMEATLPVAKFPVAAPNLQVSQNDVGKFFLDFMSEFSCRAQHSSTGITVEVSTNPQITYALASARSANTPYRALKSGAMAVAGFKLTKGVMSELEGWRTEFKAASSKAVVKSFPKVLEFALDGTKLVLHFPNNPHQFRQLADVVVQGPHFSTPGTHWYLETRYLERMILLAKDYGLDFDVSLLAMAGAPFAAEFACQLPSGRCKLTLPLSTGPLTGLIEITAPVPASLPAAPVTVPGNPATP